MSVKLALLVLLLFFCGCAHDAGLLLYALMLCTNGRKTGVADSASMIVFTMPGVAGGDVALPYISATCLRLEGSPACGFGALF